MSDNPVVNASGKILFGVDFLNIMRNMEAPENGETYQEEMRFVVDAAIRLFLLKWDFSVKEIDSANNLFWEKAQSNTLDEKVATVVDRVADFLKDNTQAQEQFLIEMAAIGQLDSTVLKSELGYFDLFLTRFDFRPSERNIFVNKGADWAMVLNYFGEQYAQYKNPPPQ